MDVKLFKKKWDRNREDYGFATASIKAGRFLLKPIFEWVTYRVYGIDLEAITVPSITRRDVCLQCLDGKEQSYIDQIEAMEEWLQGTLQAKLAGGSMCALALDGKNVVGFNMISFGNIFIPLLHYDKVIQEDEAWSEQISVRRDYRRHHLARDLRYYVFAELKKRRIRRLYGAAQPANRTSLQLAGKCGFTELADIHYFKFLFFASWREVYLNSLPGSIRAASHTSYTYGG